MTLSIERAEALVEEFCAAYPAASAATYTIRETQEELYGPKATREAVGTILGSFQPRSQEALFAAANFSSNHEFKRSLRHEILGHFGINTFNQSEKRALLDAIIAARSVPSVEVSWQHVDHNYPGLSESRKAEEVFAFACERIEPGVQIDHNRCVESFLDVCVDRIRPLELRDLRQITSLVAQGLHDCTRSQRIFPESNNDQFKLSALLTEHIDYPDFEPSLEDQLASQEDERAFEYEAEPSLEDQLAAQEREPSASSDESRRQYEEPEMDM